MNDAAQLTHIMTQYFSPQNTILLDMVLSKIGYRNRLASPDTA